MELKGREILLALSVRHKGEWSAIYQAIKKKEHLAIEEALQINAENRENYVTIIDPLYPEAFKCLEKPPFLFFYRGDIQILKSKMRLAALGTRNPTPYQEKESYKLLCELEKQANSEVAVISGMAKGLDTIATKAALESNAPAVVVLGGGIDLVYPPINKDIYQSLEKRGLIISEYPAGCKPLKEHFVFRNRLTVALSQVVFIMGGKKISGTSTSAKFALEQGKDIIALPCDNTGDDLTNSLIKDGAYIATSSFDLLELLTPYKNIS